MSELFLIIFISSFVVGVFSAFFMVVDHKGPVTKTLLLNVFASVFFGSLYIIGYLCYSYFTKRSKEREANLKAEQKQALINEVRSAVDCFTRQRLSYFKNGTDDQKLLYTILSETYPDSRTVDDELYLEAYDEFINPTVLRRMKAYYKEDL